MIGASVCMVIASGVIVGWVVGIPYLTTIGIGSLAAQPLTAVIFGLVATAQLVALRGHSRCRLALLGVAVTFVIVSQTDLLLGQGFAFNRALIGMLRAATAAHVQIEPPRPTTIAELLLLIGASLPATATGRRRARAALALATIALLIGGVVMIGYVNRVDIAGLHNMAFVMSFPSAAMSLALSASIIVWRYCDGWPAIFWTAPEESASWSLLPLLLILIVIEFGFRLLADRGVIEDGIADALTLVADMTIIVAIVVPGSHRLAERRRERDDLAGAVELAAVMVLDRDGVILHWSRGCADLYGWPSERAVGQRRSDLLGNIGDLPADEIRSSTGDDGTYYSEIVEYHRDGRKLIIANHAKRLKRASDRAAAVIAVTNITDRRAAEAALQSSEARLLAAVEVQGLTIIEWDVTDDRIEWTINPEALCGPVPIRTSEDFRAWGKGAIDARDWADLERDVREGTTTGGGKFRRTVQVQRAPGVFHLFEMATSLICEDGARIRAILTCNDVTEHYRREEAIMLGEARLATAVAAQGIFIYEYDLAAERPIWTTSAQHFLGVSVDMEVPDAPDSHWDLIPEVARQVRAAAAKAIEAGNERIHFSFEFQRLDGERRYADSWARIIRDNDGHAIRVIGTHLDITERHEREAALRASEAEMRAILATVPDAMIVCNDSGIIRAHSATAETLFGFAGADLIGRNILDLAADDQDGQAVLRRRLRDMTVRARSGIWPIPVMARRADGEIVPVSFVVGDAVVGGQRMFVVFGRDMRPHIASEEKFHKLQSQLAQVARLATMGEMGGALAHELSQPLAAIVNFLGAAELTMQTDGNHDRLDRAILSASEQAVRASEIIRRLRALISRGEADMQVESITRLIREAAALALFNISSLGVRLSYDFEDEDRAVMADGVQIQQVLVNLIRNGVDAMTTGGSMRRELIISTSLREDDFLAIDVSDTGPGIDPDIVDTLFSPFTTTKSDGLGFGLSICRRIVEAHGGRLCADKSLSGGAVFRFTLPVAGEEAQRS
jgi:two-component system sensor kinase FixL